MGKLILCRNNPQTPQNADAFGIPPGQWEILGTLMNGGTLLIRTSDWKYVLERVCVSFGGCSGSLTDDRRPTQ